MTTFAILPRWWITAAALFVSAVLLSPFYWVLVGSFMTPAELFGGHMSLWPRHFAFENWSAALSRLWPHIQNSLLVSAAASVGTLLITAPASYGLVWRKPRGRQTLSAFMLMTQMLPAIVFVIPLFIGGGPANGTHLLSTYAYQVGFSVLNFGEAAAIATLMVLLVLLLNLVQLVLQRRWD
jgi:ABC-type glycerol-3-phosphate transport system permease component